MPTLADYRHNLALESGPYVGPEAYTVKATSGSTTTKLVCDVYPIQSGLAQQDLLMDRPLYRPNAVLNTDRNRVIMVYDPPTGTITPDLAWTISPLSPLSATSYQDLEAHTYRELEAYTYECLEGTGVECGGLGEMFEILGPWDAPTMLRLINDGLKQCWLVVEVACVPTPGATRHDLRLVAPWIQDANHVRQAGLLAAGDDRNLVDPFERTIYGKVEHDGGTFYFNTDSRSFNDGDTIYLRCYKRAYDHCRMAGGVYGEQSGLAMETDEAPVERDWAVASALLVGWRRFAHLLEPMANQRLIRDQASAAAWFNERTRQHFTAVQPTLTFRTARRFGPVAVA